MQPATSLFLDSLRFTAAFVVLLHHATSREVNSVLPWVRWGHEAVVAFFVMSGFLIAYVVSSRERDITQYAAARLGRLYSVVLPALLATALLDSLGRRASPELYSSIPGDYPALRLLINFLFLQQNWNLTVAPLSNGPFWSLGNEFWYYMIFGAWALLHGRKRIALALLFCVCAGPRIVAFLPTWLLGVLAFHAYHRWEPSREGRRVLLSLSAIALVAILMFGNPLVFLREAFRMSFPDNYVDMGFARIFLGDIPRLPEDLLLGALLGLLIATVRGTVPRGMTWDGLGASIRYLAGASFSMYLFHFPLLYFFVAWLKIDRSSALEVVMVILLVFISCLLLAYSGERQVGHYRRFFINLFKRIRAITPTRQPPLSDGDGAPKATTAGAELKS